MQKMKRLKDLNLMDRFLFAEAMEDPENFKTVVEIIIIASFDLFGLGKYMYTFKMRCEEAPGVTLDDGAIRIFLNTNGKHPEEVNPELVELVRYMENTNEEATRGCKSERIRQIWASEEVSPPSSKDALCMIFA